MVPTLTCGLSRSNFSFATLCSLLLKSYWRGGCVLANQEKLSRSARGRPLGRFGLAAAAFDDLLRDVRRDLVVAVELHRVRGPALRVGTQVGRVPEHLRQRDLAGHGKG